MTQTRAEQAIGIDLGTTYSVVAHLDADGRPWTILNGEGDLTTPSVVYFDKSEAVVGKEAVKVAEYEPDHIAQFVKRDMGSRVFHKSICGRELPPEVIQSLILKKLKHDAELKLGPVSRAVITVPAYFNEPRRKATQDAGRLAGLEVLDIINEPTAAAIAYGVQQGFLNPHGESRHRETVMVYDLGGGTFDVTLMDIDGRDYTALATAGDVYLGGIDWDMRIVDFIAAEFEKEFGEDPRKDDCALQMLLHEAEDAKRALSGREEVKIHFAHEGRRVRLTLGRQTFEELTGDLLDRTLFTIRKLLRDAKKQWSDVTRLLLVGGSSRMPMIQAMLERESGLAVDRSLSPDEAVAHGAAVYAGMLNSGQSPEQRKIRLTNVNSHDLGVLGVERATGLKRRQVMISRNTPLPATATHTFTTYEDNQRNVVVNVIEGGDASGNNSTPIGTCVVTGLPNGLPAKTPVAVRFSYASNGRLTVEASLPSVKRQATLTIERAAGLSPTKLDEWAERIERGVSGTSLKEGGEVKTESGDGEKPFSRDSESSERSAAERGRGVEEQRGAEEIADSVSQRTSPDSAPPTKPFFVKRRPAAETETPPADGSPPPAAQADPLPSPPETTDAPKVEEASTPAPSAAGPAEPIDSVAAAKPDLTTGHAAATTISESAETVSETEPPATDDAAEPDAASSAAELPNDAQPPVATELAPSPTARQEQVGVELGSPAASSSPAAFLDEATATGAATCDADPTDSSGVEERAEQVQPVETVSDAEAKAAATEVPAATETEVQPTVASAGVVGQRLSFSEINDQADGVLKRRRRLRALNALAMTTLMHVLVLVALAMIILPSPVKDAFAVITSSIAPTEQEQFEEKLEVQQEVVEAVNFNAGSVTTTAVGGSNSQVVSAQKLEQSTALRDPNVQVNLSTMDLPGMEVIGQDLGEGEVTGEVGAVVEGYGAALDRITQELIRMLRTQRLLVVWLFDESGSMKDDQADIKSRIGHVYEELELNVGKVSADQSRKKFSDHLLTSIVSFGGEYHVQTPEPTADIPTLMKAIEKIPVDETGVENTCQAIMNACTQYGRFNRGGQDRKIVLIVVSDESGDDGHLVEEALYHAMSIKAPLYFMGRESVFGSLYAHIRWIQPSTGQLFLLPIRRGPETPFAEQLQFDGFDKRTDAQMSGFGPYEQVRLARKTGGVFFQLPREEQDLNGLALFEAKELMLQNREYLPDLSARREYAEHRDKSPFRKAIWDVILILNPYDKNASRLFVETRGWFSNQPAQYQAEVTNRLNRCRDMLELLALAQKHLDDVAPLRDREPSVRWRANYDLIRAQIFAYQVRLFEYGIGLGQFSRDVADGKMFKDPKSNVWHVGHGVKDLVLPDAEQSKALKVTGEQLQSAMAEAIAGFERVQKEHPNTPWAMRAAWEMGRNFGVTFVEAFHDPKIPTPTTRTNPPPPPKL